MSDTTPRLGLSWVMPNQAQKHVTVNETFGRLDAMVCAHALSRAVLAQPESPSEGDCYILASGFTGADWQHWAANDLVYFQDGAWHRIAARKGLIVFVADEAASLVFQGSDWMPIVQQVSFLNDLTGLGIGTSADATNAFAAKLNTTLWTARYEDEGGTGDLRYTLNKQSSAKALSLVFQSNWSGRAEFGLTGNDDFTLKTSADGAGWIDNLVLRAVGGPVNLPNLPTSAAGLVAGDLWNDSGTLKVVV